MNKRENNIKNTGLIIKDLCKEKDITVQELEKRCGLGNGSVNRWVSGSSPTIKMLTTISEYFNVSIDYLAGLTEQKDKFDEWNKKYNVKKLADEAKLFDSIGKLKRLFSDVELIDLNENDMALLKAYLELLQKRKE